MAGRKSRKACWSDVQPNVLDLDQDQGVKLLADLYRFSRDNPDFFHTRFGIGPEPIEEGISPDIHDNTDRRVKHAEWKA